MNTDFLWLFDDIDIFILITVCYWILPYSGYISNSSFTIFVVAGWPAKNASLYYKSWIQRYKHGFPSFSSDFTSGCEILLFIWQLINKACAAVMVSGAHLRFPSFNLNLSWTVGSGNGEVTLWEIGLRERLVSKPFKIWEMTNFPLPFQVLIHLRIWSLRNVLSMLFLKYAVLFVECICFILHFSGAKFITSLECLIHWSSETMLWSWFDYVNEPAIVGEFCQVLITNTS